MGRNPRSARRQTTLVRRSSAPDPDCLLRAAPDARGSCPSSGLLLSGPHRGSPCAARTLLLAGRKTHFSRPRLSSPLRQLLALSPFATDYQSTWPDTDDSVTGLLQLAIDLEPATPAAHADRCHLRLHRLVCAHARAPDRPRPPAV